MKTKSCGLQEISGCRYWGIGEVGSMKKLSCSVVLLMMVMLMASNEAAAFRCGTRLVSVGDSKYEVLWKCGEPTWVESWVEKRIQPYSVEPFSDGYRFYLPSPTFATVVYVNVEQWVYDQGRTQFTRVLTFENSRLARIEMGDYGH
jgi:hypothetical protein